MDGNNILVFFVDYFWIVGIEDVRYDDELVFQLDVEDIIVEDEDGEVEIDWLVVMLLCVMVCYLCQNLVNCLFVMFKFFLFGSEELFQDDVEEKDIIKSNCSSVIIWLNFLFSFNIGFVNGINVINVINGFDLGSLGGG